MSLPFAPPRVPVPDRFASSVGAGWAPIVESALAKVRCLVPDIEVVEVKQKFGALRVYVTKPHDVSPLISAAVDELFHAAAVEASSVCETCGQPGRMRGPGWLWVGCAHCAIAAGEVVSPAEQRLVAALGPDGTRVASHVMSAAERDFDLTVDRIVERDRTFQPGDDRSAQRDVWWSLGRPQMVERATRALMVLIEFGEPVDERSDRLDAVCAVETPEGVEVDADEVF